MKWWEAIPLGRGQEVELQVGLLALRVARQDQRLRVAWRYLARPEPEVVSVQAARPLEEPTPDWTVHRYAAHGFPDALTVRPRTADRSVVARPDVPFSVEAGAEVRVFVGTAIWVNVAGVVELPTVPPKQTWLGTFVEGELCYAMRTHLRMRIDDLELRAHRAIAPVVIRNEGDDALRIDRVAIPVPSLSLHVDETGRLWTQELVLLRREDHERAERKLGRPGPGVLLAEPRQKQPINPVMRVFNSVFG